MEVHVRETGYPRLQRQLLGVGSALCQLQLVVRNDDVTLAKRKWEMEGSEVGNEQLTVNKQFLAVTREK